MRYCILKNANNRQPVGQGARNRFNLSFLCLENMIVPALLREGFRLQFTPTDAIPCKMLVLSFQYMVRSMHASVADLCSSFVWLNFDCGVPSLHTGEMKIGCIKQSIAIAQAVVSFSTILAF
jgi:hypothetical protein